MDFLKSKKGIFVFGIIAGIGAAILAATGNPKNMAFCIACFIRDSAGAMKMHNAEIVQYFRPEIVGLVLGSFIISLASREYRATAGSSPVIRFLLGVIMMIGALVFLGCPLRMVLRMSAGDVSSGVLAQTVLLVLTSRLSRLSVTTLTSTLRLTLTMTLKSLVV